MKPISDFCCKPANEAEAREIVERAVAHGAELRDRVVTGEDKYGWKEYPYWGAFNGKTRAGWLSFLSSETEYPAPKHLTLDQLRKRAPFVSEIPSEQIEAAKKTEGWFDIDGSKFMPLPDSMHNFLDSSRYDAIRRALHFAGMLDGESSEIVGEEDPKRIIGECGGPDIDMNFNKGGEHDGVRMAGIDGPELCVKGPDRIIQDATKQSLIAPDFLRAALGHMDDRAATYDAPSGERSMGKTVTAFNALYGTSLTEEQGWAFMCLLKLVRTSQGAFRADNYEDLSAYAGLMGEAAIRGESE